MAALVDPLAVDPGALLRAAENSDLRVAESDAAFPLLLFVWPVQTLQFPRRTRVHSRDELGSQQQHLGPKYAANLGRSAHVRNLRVSGTVLYTRCCQDELLGTRESRPAAVTTDEDS